MKKILFLVAIVCLSSLLLAHEYVLLAYKFRVQKGDTLEMHLFVADGFNIEMERKLQKSQTRKFEMLTSLGSTDLLQAGADGDIPVINRTVDFDGLALIHMERDYSRITLPTEEFKEYLKEDHIENIKLSTDPGKTVQRERYSRFVKSLVMSGKDSGGDLYKKNLGQHFEIILLQDPYQLNPGELLQAQVLFMGTPMADKVITARNRKGNQNTISLQSRTNKNGICSFKLRRDGEWFLHATHMIPCPDQTDSDWESFWASFSFEVD